MFTKVYRYWIKQEMNENVAKSFFFAEIRINGNKFADAESFY